MEVSRATEDMEDLRVRGGGMVVIGAERTPFEEIELLRRMNRPAMEDLEEEMLRYWK